MDKTKRKKDKRREKNELKLLKYLKENDNKNDAK